MIVEQAAKIHGAVRVPGDKSIAHRALILGSLSRGRHVVDGLPASADIWSTVRCLRDLGTLVEETPDGRMLVISRSPGGECRLNAGNSGTTARLLAGLLAGFPIETTMDGDESLRRRPMGRIADPLMRMGASIDTSDGRLPMTITGGNLRGIRYRLPVASAQVKSAVLIAGLLADGETTVEEMLPSRDHTERMLSSMTDGIRRDATGITVQGRAPLHGIEITVPGDVSSAAFFMVATLCLPGSEVYLPTVGVNPTRTGVIDVLREMGADLEWVSEATLAGEPVADILVRSTSLHGLTIGADIVPRLIDELPVIAVAATQAEGTTTVTGAGELRHKESDRIEAICTTLTALGANIEAREDGFAVSGPTPLRGATVDAHGDHRIAMATAVAGLLAEGRTQIEGSESVDISYPRFFDDLRTLVG